MSRSDSVASERRAEAGRLEAPTLLVEGSWVVVSPTEVLTDGAVAVRGGAIIAVGPAAALASAHPHARRYGGRDRLVIPGLINTHTHLFQTFLKGLGQGLSLYAWVRQVTSPAALAMTPRDAYLSAMVGLIEAVRSAATSVVEYSYAFPDPALHAAILQAFADVGVRGWLGVGLNDAGQEFGVNPALIRPIAESLARVDDLRRQAASAGAPVDVALTPSGLRGLSGAGLRQVSDYARAHRLLFSLHVNETSFDNEVSQQRFGKPAVAALADAGVLGPEFLAVHCVCMTDDDIRLLARHAAGVSHNPVSNMYLGSGIAPVVAMRQAGLAVGLGSDGAASNNTQDMLEALKVAALGQRAAQRRPEALTAAETVELATTGAARVVGRGEQLGSLRPGRRADLAVLRMSTAKSSPVHDPVAALVFSAGEQNVETVMVEGRVILEAGHITTVDETALLAEAQAAAQRLVARAGIA